jgi:hypothetical protein
MAPFYEVVQLAYLAIEQAQNYLAKREMATTTPAERDRVLQLSAELRERQFEIQSVVIETPGGKSVDPNQENKIRDTIGQINSLQDSFPITVVSQVMSTLVDNLKLLVGSGGPGGGNPI